MTHDTPDMIPVKRYFVDKRSGIVAVRDRQHPKYDPEYNGLHADTPDVVMHFFGIRIADGWTVSPMDVEKCEEECKRLNKLESDMTPVTKAPDWRGLVERLVEALADNNGALEIASSHISNEYGMLDAQVDDNKKLIAEARALLEEADK